MEKKDEKKDDELRNRINVDYKGCEVLFYPSNYHDQSARGNFSTARE
jgi:hypothetical protein